MATVNIKEANFAEIEQFAAVAFLGKRRTGKITWAKYFVQYLSQFCDRYRVICGNKDNISEWAEIISPLYIPTKDNVSLESIRDYQDSRCSEYTSKKLPVPRKYMLTLIIDDCGSDRQFMHSATMKDLLSNGRHYGMYIILLVQYLNQMHAVNRDQLDYIGVLFTANTKNIRKLYEEYINVCDLRTFEYTLHAITANRGLCWIDNTKSPEDISGLVYFRNLPKCYTLAPVEPWYIREHAHKFFVDEANLKKMKVHAFLQPTVNIETDGEDNTDFEQAMAAVSFRDKKGIFTVCKYQNKQKCD